MTAKNRRGLVLYGSETGNAHDLAEELGCLLDRLHFSTSVASLDAVDPVWLVKYDLVLVSVSTTGQGDLPNNAGVFWKKLLRKKLPTTYLAGAKFAVFGLGDSSYPKYNWAARKLRRRLLQLGATEVYDHGEADEQHPEGHNATFLPWCTELRQQLLEQYPLGGGVEPVPDHVLLPAKWMLALTGSQNTDNASRQSYSNGSDPDNGNPSSTTHTSDILQNGFLKEEPIFFEWGDQVTVSLEGNHRVTPRDHWQDVRHLTFTTASQLPYNPGDVLSIHPKNATEDVEQILQLMSWTNIADQQVHLVPTEYASLLQEGISHVKPTLHGKGPMTFRELLTSHLDLNAIPRRSFFALIAHFTDDEFHKNRLLEFTHPEFLDELYDYTTRPRRSIIEVLQEFDTVKIPWQWAANILPELKHRHFSIASGGRLKSQSGGETRFELLVAIVKYKTVIKKIRQGICSRYLANLSPGTILQVSLQRGGLNVTENDWARPVVMIGPGTGVAPMRSLIWERAAHEGGIGRANGHSSNAHPNGSNTGSESVLFFGGRNRNADFFFEDEWERLQREMNLEVFTAFSRDQKQKIYVQDVIRDKAELVFRLLCKAKGIVYICGSSGKMPRAVREALIEAFQTGGAMERDAAEAYLLSMEQEGRYKQETW